MANPLAVITTIRRTPASRIAAVTTVSAACAGTGSRAGSPRAITKEIARVAGYSEATLYKHFQDKTEIFLHVLDGELPGLAALLAGLDAEDGDVRADLEELTGTAVRFYVDSFPMSVSLFSTRTLLDAHRSRMHELGAGPAVPEEALTRYLAAQRDRGRLASSADPESMARLLLGACFQQAFLAVFRGEAPGDAELAELARRLVATVLGATSGAAGGPRVAG